MTLGRGFVFGVLSGGLWGLIAHILAGIALTLFTGLPATPVLLAGLLAGLVNGAILMSRPPKERKGTLLVAAFLGSVIIFLLASLAAPFTVQLSEAPVWQAVALAATIAAVTAATYACIGDMEAGKLSRYKSETVLVRVLKGLGFVFFTVIVILPFYVMVVTSLKNQQQLLLNPLDLSIDVAQGLGSLFRSYIELFTEFDFGRFLLISTIVSVCTVIITLLFSVPGAYAVARLRFPGQAFLNRSILMIYMVPAIVLVIPLYSVFSQLGLRNTLVGLLIVYPATTVPVALYMLQGYFRGLPPELEEAGLMDGLNRVGVIRRITLPLSLPALASVALYVFMIAWNEFLFAFMFLDDPAIFTLARGVVALDSSEVPRQNLMAGAVVATVPILVIFLWFERFLV